jgi:hypothetical protein
MLDFQDNPIHENRDLAGVLRRLGGVLPDRSEIDRPGFRRRYLEILNALASSFPTPGHLIALLEGAPYFVGGDEHRIVRAPENGQDRIYKFTHSDSFGCRGEFHPSDPDLLGKHFFAGVNMDLAFYLERWFFLNSITAFQTRFEGFLPPETKRQMPRVCISQPVLAPQTATNPNPTEREIEDAFLPHGYRKISDGAFLHSGTGVLLTDAAPRNVRIVNGEPIPFDAIAQLASPEVIDWAKNRLKTRK